MTPPMETSGEPERQGLMMPNSCDAGMLLRVFALTPRNYTVPCPISRE